MVRLSRWDCDLMVNRKTPGQAAQTSSRLTLLGKQVQQLQASLAEVSKTVAEVTEQQRGRMRAITEADVQQILETRRLRETCFGAEFFSDPAWDILLQLYAAKLGSRTISVSWLAGNAGVPWSTGMRSLNLLYRSGWIVRKQDRSDRRRVLVKLSDRGWSKMQRIFKAAGGAVIGV